MEIRTIRNGTCQRRRVAEICQEEKKRLAGSAVATEASVRRQLPSSRNGAEIDASFWSRDHAGYWEGAGRGAPPLDDGSVVLLIRLAPQLQVPPLDEPTILLTWYDCSADEPEDYSATRLRSASLWLGCTAHHAAWLCIG